MDYNRYRKYPRVYKKNGSHSEERILNLSAPAAGGILAAVFLGGTVLGCIFGKKWFD